MSRRPRVLVTNDDGFGAPGIEALADALAALGDVIVVAPDRERSGVSHALTFTRPLRARRVGRSRYRVDGTPTDCVHLGVFDLSGDGPPDLVVSGINRGLNVGDDVTYSGTVAGALEGTLLHVPSIAVSTSISGAGDEPRYDVASDVATTIATRVLAEGLPDGVFLNVNVPHASREAIAGMRVTRQGSRTYRAAVLERHDPKGEPYYWIAPADTTPAADPTSDHAAIDAGFVSITPMHANLTHDASIDAVEAWDLAAP